MPMAFLVGGALLAAALGIQLPPQEEPLPDGWKSVVDEHSGHTGYINTTMEDASVGYICTAGYYCGNRLGAPISGTEHDLAAACNHDASCSGFDYAGFGDKAYLCTQTDYPGTRRHTSSQIKLCSKPVTCVDLTGDYVAYRGRGVIGIDRLTQSGCRGTRGHIAYTVSGGTITSLRRRGHHSYTGSISGSTGAYIITWSTGDVYKQADPTAVAKATADLKAKAKANKKSGKAKQGEDLGDPQILTHVEAYDPRMKNWMPQEPTKVAVVPDAPTGRIAVFSAQFGGRDRVQYKLNEHMRSDETGDDWISIEGANRWTETTDQIEEQIPDGVEAFLFTDMINVDPKNNSPWQFVYPARQFEELCGDNVLCLWKGNTNLTRSQKNMRQILASKFFKTRWIAENTQYDYIVWMDGKYVLRNRMLTETIHTYMGEGVDMLAMIHPTRSTVAAELGPASARAAQVLQENASDISKQANAAYKRYNREGFSDAIGLFDSAMFIVRPARVHDMFIDWWHEVQQGIPRDQISLPWMIQKHGINVHRIGRYPCTVLGAQCKNPQAHNR